MRYQLIVFLFQIDTSAVESENHIENSDRANVRAFFLNV